MYSDIQPRLDETEMHVADCLATLTDRGISHLLSLMYPGKIKKTPEYLDNRDLPTRQFDKIKFKVIKQKLQKGV